MLVLRALNPLIFFLEKLAQFFQIQPRVNVLVDCDRKAEELLFPIVEAEEEAGEVAEEDEEVANTTLATGSSWQLPLGTI